MLTLHQALQRMLDPRHLRRTLLIAFIVGSWLTAFNQGDVLFTEPMTTGLWLKILLNYLTPFVVANLGLLAKA